MGGDGFVYLGLEGRMVMRMSVETKVSDSFRSKVTMLTINLNISLW